MNANANQEWSDKLKKLNDEFPKGTKVEITSGKWKKKWGFVQSVSPGYSQVEIHNYLKSKAKGDAEDEVKVSVWRVKSPYLKKIVEQGWNMPDAEDWVVVDKMPEDTWGGKGVDADGNQLYKAEKSPKLALPKISKDTIKKAIKSGLPDWNQSPADNKLCEEIVNAMTQDEVKEAATFGVAEALSDHDSEDDPVDISEDLPTIDEALVLKVRNETLIKEKGELIKSHNDARFEVQQLKEELREAKELYKCLEHDKGQAENVIQEYAKQLDVKDTDPPTRAREKAEKWNKVKALFIELLDEAEAEGVVADLVLLVTGLGVSGVFLVGSLSH